MKIITVIPLKKNTFKEELTYFSAKEVEIGSIVSVPVRNNQILALVISVDEANTLKSEVKNMDFNLKKITETKEISIFTKEFIKSTYDTSRYFATSQSNVISYLIPNILKEKYDHIAKLYLEKNTNNLKEEKNNKKNEIDILNIQTEKVLYQAPLEDRIAHYKTLVRSAFANKKSIFIVLPNQHDITHFEEYLKKGIENFTVSLHSGHSAKKILEHVEKVITEEHPLLILGTAPFLSLNRQDINTVIIEHENSSMYKTIARPYFDLRVYVELWSTQNNIKLILADDLLRFETIARRELDNLNELGPLSFRINFEGEIKILEKNRKIPNIELEQDEKNKFKILSDESIAEVKKRLDKKQKIFIYTLRKGLATSTVCKNCANEVSCEECLAPLVLYTSKDGKKRMFVCNKCNTEKDALITCKYCASWDLVPLGIGTDTVYEEIKRIFPKNKIFKLDKEVAKNNKDAEKIIKNFEENENTILVGTEMALSYLKEKVDTSIIASFDSLWSIPNYKMSEKILQIVLNILNHTKKNLIIETKNINDGALSAIKNTNLLSYVREELEERKKLEYPPYKRFIKISFLGNKEETQKTRKFLSELFEKYKPNIFGGFISEKQGKYTTNMLIKLDIKDWSLPSLSSLGHINEDLYNKLYSLPIDFQIQIDPEDLL